MPNIFFMVVTEDINNQTYHASRSIKRITLLLCISKDGNSFNPMIIVPRLTLDNRILEKIISC